MFVSHRSIAFAALLLVASSGVASAQSDAPVGVRAAGMGGAFVAVADDASAVFWNPAGLATGSYFSLVIDRNEAETPDDADHPRRRSALLIAIGTPPLGLSYYRTRSLTRGSAASGTSDDHLENLIAHHTGVTLVQTVSPGISVGATLKLVRGIASSTTAASGIPFEQGDDLIGRASNKFDADFGILASSRTVKLGVSVRNAFEPSFDSAGDGGPLTLERRVRAGAALTPSPFLTLSADADFTKVSTSGGPWRDAAVGTEARLSRRAWARGGVHWNTAGGDEIGTAAVGSVGGSYLLYGSLIADAQVSFGSRNGDRGWGVGARLVF